MVPRRGLPAPKVSSEVFERLFEGTDAGRDGTREVLLKGYLRAL